MIKKAGLGTIAAGAIALALSGTAHAAFPERDVTFIIPYGPGGGFDTYVRKIAPVMAKYLKVNVIPKNVAGGGGRKALNVLWRDKSAGHNISIFNMPGMMLDEILGKKTTYDIMNFTWLGRIAQSKYVLTVSTKGNLNSVADLKKAKNMKYAVTSRASGSYVAGKIMADAMGLDVTFLPGYKGSAKISLSIIRGDTHLSLFNTRSFAKWAKGGDLKTILSFEDKSSFKGVPNATEAGYPSLHALTIERVVGTAPGVSKSTQKKLSDALFSALNDPEIQAWHKKTKRPIDPLSADDTAKMLADRKAFFTKYKDVLK